MKVFGLTGASGSGKTTLLTAILPLLRARGLSVSTVKHAHHGFDIDKPGKDSYRHREAGAEEVMLVSGNRWALLHECRDEPEPPVDMLLGRMQQVDLCMIEGFKTHRHKMIEVYRPAHGRELFWKPGTDIIAIASDGPVDGVDVPVLDLNDPKAIAGFILAAVDL